MILALVWAEVLNVEEEREIVYAEIEYRLVDTEIASSQPQREVKQILNPDIIYLAKCIEAEAGNQGYLGKVYVCDVILNRLDSGRWGNSITDVINYPNAFSVVSNGRINKAELSNNTIDIILDELEDRTNSEILSFKTGDYHKTDTPCFRYKDHYFSK